VYEFIPEDELQLTHPINNETFTSGVSEVIYWDAANNSNSDFLIEFQIEGGAWQSLAMLPAEERSFNWTPPVQNSIRNFKLRISRDGQISESNTFTVGAQPTGLNIGWICDGIVEFDWNDVIGATDYQVYVLGEKYMEAQTNNVVYNGSSATISGLTEDINLLAVSAITNGKEGRRSNSIEVDLNDNILNISTSSNNASCGNNDGMATAASDANGVLYTWSNGDNTPSTNNLAPGTYTVTVSNNGGCQEIYTFEIEEEAQITISTIPANGGNNGSATATPNSGTAPFTYAWSNGANTSTIDNLVAGSYDITITDVNGCVGTGQAIVPDDTPTYCESQGTNTNFEWIESIDLADISNFSGNNGGYADFTTISTDLSLGETINFTLIPGFTSTLYNETWQIWIDFNRDLDFEDPGEEVFLSDNVNTPILDSFVVPNNVMTGTTRMRISMKWDDAPEPCEIFTYGEVEDYTVNIVGEEPLTVNIFSTDETCLNDNDGTITVIAMDGTGNYTYDWSNGATSAVITDLAPGDYSCTVDDGNEAIIVSTTIAPGISNTFYADTDNDGFGDINNTIIGGCTPPNGFTTNNTDCDDNDANNYIGAACDDNDPLTSDDVIGADCNCAGTPEYCGSQGSVVIYEWIESIILADINNISGANNGYGDFTDLSTNLELGDTVSFTLTPGFSDPTFDELWKIWIDFNHDFDFDDPGEEVFFADHISTTINGSFVMPEVALTGETRMRISMKWGNLLDPCDDFLYGEVEDYTVNITTTNSSLYCNSQGDNSNLEYINHISIGDLNNTSGNNGGYGDYTNLALNTNLDATINVSLTPEFPNIIYTEYWKIWIDYNKDGDFDDPNEEVFSPDPSETTVVGSFTIPPDIPTGATRMRVSMKWNEEQTACETFSYGEVEDYTIFIGSNTLLSVDERSNNHEADAIVSKNLKNSITVFPNPVDHFLNITYQLPAGQYEMRVFDIKGQQVSPMEILQTDGRNQIVKINADYFVAGNYIVKISGKNGTLTQQFIKR